MSEAIDRSADGADRGPGRWRLRLLGDFALSDPAGAAVPIKPRKGRALVAWLALVPPHAASRERLTALLWSDRAPEQARGSLRQCLHEMKALGEGENALLATDADAVALSRSRLVTDLEEIQGLARADALDPLRAALDRAHRGLLLTDLDHVDQPFDDWLALERMRRLAELVDASVAAGERGMEAGDVSGARAIATALQIVEPADERAAQLGMRADAAAGDYASVRRRFQLLAEHLRQELDAAPAPPTRRLLETLTAEGEAGGPLAAEEAASAESPRAASLAPPAVRSVARKRSRLAVFALAAAVMLTGPASDTMRPAVRASATPSQPQAQIPALAVLPFADLSPGRDRAYFAEGITEELVGLLSQSRDLRVAGRSSTAMLGRNASFEEARRRLGVTHLLEGSVRVQGQRLRVNVRLVNTADGMQLWSQRFDRELSDIFAVQDDIAAGVASRLRSTLAAPAAARPRSSRTSIEAYDLFLAATNKAQETSFASLAEAQRLLERVIALDPGYAPAWARLALYQHYISQLRPGGPFGEQWPQDREQALLYARRALALDPNLAEAQATLGYFEGYPEFPERALARLRRAIELDQGNYYAWRAAGHTYAALCDPDRAILAWRRAAAIEPLLHMPRVHLVSLLAIQGRFAEAEQVRRDFLARSRNSNMAAVLDATIAVHSGDPSRAIVQLERYRRSNPTDPYRAGELAYQLRALGATQRAIPQLPSDYRRIIGPFWQGDYRSAALGIDRLRTSPWHSLRSFAVTKALVRSGRDRELLAVFDRRFGSVDEFDRRLRCDLPFHAAPVVLALRRAGRGGEADRLLGLAEARHRQALRALYYRPGVNTAHPELMMLAGRPEAALASLELAVGRGGLGDEYAPHPILDLADPVYNPLRNHPRFRAAQRRLEAFQARERREVLQAGVPL